MSLDPSAQAHLQRLDRLALTQLDQLSPVQARAQSRWLRAQLQASPAPADTAPGRLQVQDLRIPGPAGMLAVRLYRPAEALAAAGPWPGCLFFHGGGWVLGDLDTQDQECRMLAVEAGCVVVSVDYRLAPEYPFPAAPEDAYAATAWLAAQATAIGIDPARLAVAGMSAGANLAAAVTLMARQRQGPALLAQVLMVPVTHHHFDTPSYRQCAEGYDLGLRSMRWFWQHYLARPEDGLHPWASPLLAPDLTGLPPALVLVSQYDPLRDEGVAYARRLREQGVEVHTVFHLGMMHGFQGPEAIWCVIRYLRTRLA
ncbi:alpha/beta hydrolase [Herbaspirillum sp.]|uniref:alpha/beta hydrolase n=1 Tax=Herbaspirillum sp. TaxID=1890675 RepID=UPI0031D6F964